MDLFRTDDSRFADLPEWPYSPNYLQIGETQMHFIDEGPREGPATVLCLHGNPSWGYLYRHMIPVFGGAGLRVIAPDLIGFGRSDKPANEADHTFKFHRDVLLQFVEQMNLQNVMLVCQDWGGIFGLTLPMARPERYTRLLVMNTALATGTLTEGFRQWRAYSNSQRDLAVGKLLSRGNRDVPTAQAAAYDAPFPDATYKAALRAFPNLLPDGAKAPGAAFGREAAAFWSTHWSGASFMAVGMRDPVFDPLAMAALRAQIRGCPPPLEVAEGGHFVQEWGAPIARAALTHFQLG